MPSPPGHGGEVPVCGRSFPGFLRSSSLAGYTWDRAGGGAEPRQTQTYTVPRTEGPPFQAENISSGTGRDGPWVGIRAGRYNCSQELRACLLYSTNHRLLGLSALVYTKLQVYLCSLAGTSTLSAFLSNSQGVEGSLFCLGRGQTPEASDSSWGQGGDNFFPRPHQEKSKS